MKQSTFAASAAAQASLKLLTIAAIALAMATILLGAYTRLTDAGLGCPDWPGCYGQLSAPKVAAQITQAQIAFPALKVDPQKAHNEMLHRYIAGVLSLFISGIFLLSLWQKKYRLLTGLIGLSVVAQALLGMWTVTMNLLPLVVLGHLLGGFALLSMLMLLYSKLAVPAVVAGDARLSRLIPFAWVVLVLLIIQIALGGWTSANYAALVCHQLPVCEPGWSERFDLLSAFRLPLDQPSYQYGVLAYEARISIHVLHRIGAFVTLIMLGSFAGIAWRWASTTVMRRLALWLLGLLILQVLLGVINVLFYLPLVSAVAHNFVAANLLMFHVVFIYWLYCARDGAPQLCECH